MAATHRSSEHKCLQHEEAEDPERPGGANRNEHPDQAHEQENAGRPRPVMTVGHGATAVGCVMQRGRAGSWLVTSTVMARRLDVDRADGRAERTERRKTVHRRIEVGFDLGRGHDLEPLLELDEVEAAVDEVTAQHIDDLIAIAVRQAERSTGIGVGLAGNVWGRGVGHVRWPAGEDRRQACHRNATRSQRVPADATSCLHGLPCCGPMAKGLTAMSTDGFEGFYVETRSYTATAAFWSSMGFTPVFETDHGSGQWQHPGGGPYVFINEQSDGSLETHPILRVADGDRYQPGPEVEVAQPFRAEHWGMAEALVRDPDGRVVSLQSPLPHDAEQPDADAHHREVYGTD